MKYIFLLISLLVLPNLNASSQCKQAKPFALVELFTSQGCSSCPPADAILRQLKTQNTPGLFLVSFHVDYWNYIGWRDPFSKKKFSQRQKQYATFLQSNNIYTPQAIVNGLTHLVGSSKSQLQSKIKMSLKKTARQGLAGKALLKKGQVNVKYTISCGLNTTRVHVLLLQKRAARQVKRGENRGEFLKHVNVVREMHTRLTLKSSVSFTYKVRKKKDFEVLIFTQDSQTGAIGGARAFVIN